MVNQARCFLGAEPKSPVNEFYTTISYLSYVGMRDTIAVLHNPLYTAHELEGLGLAKEVSRWLVRVDCQVVVVNIGNINSTNVGGSRIMNGTGGSGDFTRNGYITTSFATDGETNVVM